MTVERGAPVKVSFFGLPHLKRLRPPLTCEENGVRVASLLDLAGTKVAVVQQRSEMKDYLDIDAILTTGHITLITTLAAGQAIHGKQFNAQTSLKAIAYFGDGNLAELPVKARERLTAAVRGTDLAKLSQAMRDLAPPPSGRMPAKRTRGKGRRL